MKNRTLTDFRKEVLDLISKEDKQDIRFMLYATLLESAPQEIRDSVEGTMKNACMGEVSKKPPGV